MDNGSGFLRTGDGVVFGGGTCGWNVESKGIAIFAGLPAFKRVSV